MIRAKDKTPAVVKKARARREPGAGVAPTKPKGDAAILLRLGDLLPRIDAEWHERKLKSRSETIRVLLKEALKDV